MGGNARGDFQPPLARTAKECRIGSPAVAKNLVKILEEWR